MKFKRIGCICVALSLLVASGCGDKQTKPDEVPAEKTVASCGEVKDPWGAARTWMTAPGEQPEGVQALLSAWEKPTVARLWREDGDAHAWKAIIASGAEPGAQEEVILLSITYAADGPDYVASGAEVGSATELWPEL